MSENKDNFRVIAQNKIAFHHYEITEKIEVGVVLMGSEVKSLRMFGASIAQSYASSKANEIFIYGSSIAEYKDAKNFGHTPQRVRKLLLRKVEIRRITGMIQKKGLTLIPLSLYFNNKNMVKILLGIAKGKKKFDKRESEKRKDWEREKQRVAKYNF